MKRGRHPYGPSYDFSPFVLANCRPGLGARTCRFLTGALELDGGLHCGKLDPVIAQQIAVRYAAKSMVARSDNCPGRPFEETL